MSKKRASGEGSIRKKPNGRWEGRYTVGGGPRYWQPVLIQTGAVSQAQATLPQLKQLLGDKSLKYILISHFESDECGGLSLVLKEFIVSVKVSES